MTEATKRKQPRKIARARGSALNVLLSFSWLKFWKKVYLFAEKKVRENHLKKHHNDIKCPNCNVWFSVSGLRYKHMNLDCAENIISIECGQCKEVSHWNSQIAPVLILCDINGVPI